MSVLDAGCGEGKNAIYLARQGARVHALDISERAIQNAKKAWENCESIIWEITDIRQAGLENGQYDLIIAYGLLHCLSNAEEVEATVRKLQNSTRPEGYNLICAFNDRYQDLAAHPRFSPTLLSHQFYLQLYRNWGIQYFTDEDLYEMHPHNNIPHTHSLTRLIAQKGNNL